MKTRRTGSSARVPAPAPAPVGAGVAGEVAVTPEAERSASTDTGGGDEDPPQRHEITDRAPKCHRPVFAYSGKGDERVLARRMPEGWWVRDCDEVILGWDPVAWGQPD